MKILIALYFLSLNLFASSIEKNDFSEDEYVFQEDGKFFIFSLHHKDKYFISTHCLEKNKKCISKEILSKKLIVPKDVNLKGGRHLGDYICQKMGGSKLIFMKNQKGNKVSICQFTDKSMISTGILEKLVIQK